MELFDNHAHYNDERFNEDRDEIIKEIYNSGVTKFICAGYNLESSVKALEIAEKYAIRGEDYFRLAMLTTQIPSADLEKVLQLYEQAIESQPDEKWFAASFVAFTDQLHDINLSARAWKYLLKFELTPEEKEAYEKFKKVYDMVNGAK